MGKTQKKATEKNKKSKQKPKMSYPRFIQWKIVVFQVVLRESNDSRAPARSLAKFKMTFSHSKATSIEIFQLQSKVQSV